MLTRRALLAGAGAGVAATTLAACGSKPTPRTNAGVDKVTFLTGFNITGQDSYMYVGIDKGWFREAGIEVTVQAGAGTDKNLATMTSGAAQFATIDLAGGIIAVKREPTPPRFKIFAGVYQRSVSCIVALPQAGIRSPRDLAGKTIGYTPGGVNYSIFPAYARQAGLDPNAVRWQQMAPQAIRPALISGQLDAATEIVIGKPAVETAAHSSGKLGAGQSITVLPYADYLRDVIGNAIGCTEEMAATNPDLVGRFRDAAMRALEWTVNNPGEAGEIMAKHTPTYKADVAIAEVKETIPYVRIALDVLGYLDPVRVTQCIALLQALGLVASGVTVDQVVAVNLLPRQ